MSFLSEAAKGKEDGSSCVFVCEESLLLGWGEGAFSNHNGSIKCDITPVMIVMPNSHEQQLLFIPESAQREAALQSLRYEAFSVKFAMDGRIHQFACVFDWYIMLDALGKHTLISRTNRKP